MLVESFYKDPSAILDYYMDWTTWLAGDTIVDSAWAADGTVILSDPGVVGTMTSIWVEGGQAGELINLTNHVVTAEGRQDARTLRLKLRY